jgi:hypothetical protein
MSSKKRSDERDEMSPATESLAELLGITDDVEAMTSVVMMEAAQSAREDLRAIMAGVKAVNAAKQHQREVLGKMQRDQAAAAVAGAERRGIEFSECGLGGAEAYERVKIAIPDPESPGGVRFAEVCLVDGAVTSKAQLDAAVDTIKGQLDSMSELGEMESLRLQMAMDRLSKMMSTLSNVPKKISETSSSITQNIK